jgi:hypothetical protein
MMGQDIADTEVERDLAVLVKKHDHLYSPKLPGL